MDILSEINKNNELEIKISGTLVSVIGNGFYINNDFISNIRSFYKRKKILSYIMSNIYYKIDDENDDAIDCTTHCFLEVFGLNLEELTKIDKNKEDILLIAFNSLYYSYNKIWFDTRKEMNYAFMDYFNNISDNELDVIISLVITGNLPDIMNFIDLMPKVELIDKDSFVLKAIDLLKRDIEDYLLNYKNFEEQYILLNSLSELCKKGLEKQNLLLNNFKENPLSKNFKQNDFILKLNLK